MSTLTSTTSSTRPTLGSGDVGKSYFETDSNKILVWDGTGWNEWNADAVLTPGFNNNYSVTLDGVDDYVLIPSNSSYAFGTGDFSIICWFNADAIPGTYHVLWDFRPSGTGTYPSFWLGTTSGFRYYFNTGSTVINYDTTPNTSTWYMSSVVRNSGTTTVYLNGSSVASGSNTESYSTPTSGIRLGVRGDNNFDYDGYLDEFAIFNTALTSSQISDIYNSGSPDDLSTFSPLTWLRMGDGDTGSTVIDHGSLGNDASLQNNASFSTTSVP